MPDTNVKARYWWAVLYPENMLPDWEDEIAERLQLPFVYCVHNADKDGKGEERKEHVHVMIAYGNTTTYKAAMQTFNRLSAPGKQALNTCENVVDVRHAYDYLIHDTDSCRKKKKRPYSPDDRICGNNFDIGVFEQVSAADKERMMDELAELILSNGFTNYADFYECVIANLSTEHRQLARDRSGFFERLTRGNFQRFGGEKEP